jgi:4,5-DOPA dioxygenase extradiol
MRAPALFVSHGSPMTALESGPYHEALRNFGRTHAKPRAIVVVSGHWEQGPPLSVTAWRQHPLIYDFYGFPPELYQVTYPAPGDPAVAQEVSRLLGKHSIECKLQTNRGLDHGAWVPLRIMYPAADVPVVELSQPQVRTPRQLFKMGEMLAALRDQGIMIVGTGGVVHNLRMLRRMENTPPDSWAVEFDQWFKNRLESRDWEALFAYQQKAPFAREAAPTTEHFDPLFVTLGAAGKDDDLHHIYEAIEMGNMSLRTFAMEAA